MNPFDFGCFASIPEGEVAQEVTQLSPKFLLNPWCESGDRAMGS
jgi:hypothetical protein